MKYDVIIAGGGPAGLMAAVAAGSAGASVLLVDKGDKLGRKLGISGGGRCNVTNRKEPDELIRYIPGNGKFLHSALSKFGSREIIAFFEEMGIRLKEENEGRMFPVTDKAKSVVDALIRKVRSLGVEIRVNVKVDSLDIQGGELRGIRLASGETVRASAVIVATGGKSVPRTGSTGDGYEWAKQAGHTITDLYPTEVPLTSPEPWIQSRELQGLSLSGVVLTVYDSKGKKLVAHEGDMLFTHFGLSGPAALRCSQFVVKALKRSGAETVTVAIDLLPDKSADDIYAETLELARNEPKKAVRNALRGYIPERLLLFLLNRCGIDGEVTYANIPRGPWRELAMQMKSLPVRINGTLSIEEAFVTGGGVHLKEIDPRTMESKLLPGLYFCGEVLDVHGYTGGYNITAAFSTGYTAGSSAAAKAMPVHR
jgi:predicted Rossmann fold flavoprotein